MSVRAIKGRIIMLSTEGGTMAKSLQNTKTLHNLKEGFAGESQANRRYLYFARKADIEGYPDIAGGFRDTAGGATGHRVGPFGFMAAAGGPGAVPVDEGNAWRLNSTIRSSGAPTPSMPSSCGSPTSATGAGAVLI